MKFWTPISQIKKNAYNAGVIAGRNEQHRQDIAERQHIRHLEMLSEVGNPLIIVPNEWSNPIIGFGEAVEIIGNTHTLIVKDYISMENTWCGGIQMHFSEQRLNTVLELDPYELWAITATNSYGFDDYDKAKTDERWSRDRIMQALETNGFFKRWEAFKQSRGKS